MAIYRDFTEDNSMTFLVLLKEAGALPEWMQNVPEAENLKDLPAVAFADTSRRLMPMHTKEATFMSAVSSCVYDYPAEGSWENRLKAACRSYGIEDLVKRAHAVLLPEPYHQKEAAETEKKAYALSLEVTPGAPLMSYYPINSADQVEDSALKMARDLYEQRLPESWFVEAAEALMKAANDFELNEKLIPVTIRNLAESRLPSPTYLETQIERRTKQAGLSEEAQEIYKQAALGAMSGDYSAMDAAHVWELADRKLGVRYTNTVATPVASFRSGITQANFEKAAGAVVMVSDVQVPFNQLAALSDRLVAVVLPRKTAAAVLAAKAQPDGLKAASYIQGMSDEEQRQLLTLLTENA